MSTSVVMATAPLHMWSLTVQMCTDIEDTSPNRCAASFRALIVSSQFEGKALLQRHRLVNGVLAEELKDIHAFEQKTLTPQQWETQKSQ
ncbi:BolA-like protein 2 [Merluccius polli]|uniref:BolA-like protein 2 n=1 Tax=Merluccius polli TaxID=89951 RepID=A0AA47M6X4_MERPO|nr:BolA-like protein 2 [Merluccius polli]